MKRNLVLVTEDFVSPLTPAPERENAKIKLLVAPDEIKNRIQPQGWVRTAKGNYRKTVAFATFVVFQSPFERCFLVWDLVETKPYKFLTELDAVLFVEAIIEGCEQS